MTIKAETPPLETDVNGTIRVAGTRVTLETLLDFYHQGHSADDLFEAFPTVPLADIHTVIGYYLRHRGEVDAYLQANEREAEEIRRQVEAMPGNRALRQRLQAAKKAQEGEHGASAASG